MTLTGQVKWFDNRRAYGFVVVDGTDYVFGVSQIKVFKRAANLPRRVRKSYGVAQGTTVVFEPVETPRGWAVGRILHIDRSTDVPS